MLIIALYTQRIHTRNFVISMGILQFNAIYARYFIIPCVLWRVSEEFMSPRGRLRTHICISLTMYKI